MSISHLLQREIVSTTELANIIETQWDYKILQTDIRHVLIDDDYLNKILQKWKNHINLEAERISLYLQERFMRDINKDYQNIENISWYHAALIVELFKECNICKNADVLDMLKLQEMIVKQIQNNAIIFTIAWGQAKRCCGGLKTEGYYADMAEFYSIGILYLLTKTINIISKLPIKIIVITGGLRFQEALFTDKRMIKKYDQQRQQIANFFSDNSLHITFKEYQNNSHKILDNTSIANLYQNIASSKFQTLLFNIDWYYIFTHATQSSFHNIKVPHSIIEYVSKNLNINELIVMGIVALINPTTHHFWQTKFDKNIFIDTVAFMNKITLESTYKYISIHETNKNIDTLHNSIRLSVHVKHDRNDIPAIYTLGAFSKNKLSQHHVMFLSHKNRVEFITAYQAKQNKYCAFFIKNTGKLSNKHIFSWLDKQPLFYGDTQSFKLMETLSNIHLLKGTT